MLIQFLVENFLSFKDETVFSMLAPPEETRGVVEVPAHGLRLMRIAAFYGANASGKSNLIAAMETARRLIANEQSLDAKFPAFSFRLNSESKSISTRFQFDFIVADIRYTYVLAINMSAISSEALYRKLPNVTEEEMVYEREAPATTGEHHVTIGQLFDAYNEENRQFVRFTARAAHVRQPLIWKFATINVSELATTFAPIREWFQEGLTIIAASANYANLVRELHDSVSLRHFYGDMLRKMGTGVNEVQVEKEADTRIGEFLNDFNEVVQQPKAKRIIDSLIRTNRRVEGIDVDAEGNVLELKLAHSNRSGATVFFPFQDESDGTRRLLHLLPVLFHRTQEIGLCTVIDELDRSLHTTLTRHFVKEFLSMTSGRQTQLIFTTHDTNLLNGHLLPPSGIWFVEKDNDGASRIYSLSEYKPDQLKHLLEHLEEGYLQGRFGAIPFIADRKNLGWQSDEEAHKA
jgi:AAA15 family ATPase/GTPase